MICKAVIASLIVFASASSSLALLKIPSAADYESGHFLCQNKFASLVAHEKGFYVPVPIDYAHPEKGTTDIYAFAPRGLDPKLPTLFYFTGGPGLTSHWGLLREEVELPLNIVIMEQRGIGCSRPEKINDFLNPEFYSSEFVARDAELVRKSLNIEKLTIYGLSYGTVPATIYASLFPKSTRALILEGTIATGEVDLWSAPHRRKLLQKMLNTLPADVTQRMNQVSALYPNTWFSIIAREMLMQNDGLKKLKSRLLELPKEDEYKSLLDNVANLFAPITYEPHVLFTSNDVVYYMISCQELGGAQPNTSLYDSYVNNKLTPKIDNDGLANCSLLKARSTNTYFSARYPVTVPTTYFQGTDDSATAIPEAIQHYKTVPRGPKQMLILVHGGHNPNLSNLDLEEEGQKELFLKAVNGEAIPKDLLQAVQKSQELRWTYTSKKF